jgi:AcrR family transcriptional regulator
VARPRLVSDEDILSAVRKGVLEQGPSISLDVIADRLNVTSPALLKRFKTRNALLIAALKPPERPPFMDELEAGPDDRPFETQLKGVIEAITAFIDEVFPCLSALRESGIPREELRSMFKHAPPLKVIQALSGWFTRAERKGLCECPDPEAASCLLLGATQMPVSMRHMLQHGGKAAQFRVEGYANTLARIVSRGLLATSTRTLPSRKRVVS